MMTEELSKGFTGIEINGVRFSNIKEMLIYMDRQRDHIIKLEKENTELKKKYVKECEDVAFIVTNYNKQLTKAKDLFLRFIELKNKPCASGHSINMLLYENICAEVEQFLSEADK